MKKTILFVVAIAMTFVAFAFAPAETNNALDNAEDFKVTDLNFERGTCNEHYKTATTFSECRKINSDEIQGLTALVAKSSTLAKY